MTHRTHKEAGIPVVVYPPAWRVLAAALFALSRASLALIALVFVLGWVISPPLLVRLVFFLALIPGLAALLIRVLFRAGVRVHEAGLSLRRTGLYRRGEVLELNPADIRDVQVWTIPLPGSGVSFSLASDLGLRSFSLQADNASSLVDLLRPASASGLGSAEKRALAYAVARSESRLRRWHQSWFKFGVFGLFPLFVVFRLHQNVMWGGLLGQYHLQGLAPYLSSLAYHAIMMLITLVLYAAFWRLWVELACWLAARRSLVRAVKFRKWGEVFALTLYFAGIPAFIVWRSFV